MLLTKLANCGDSDEQLPTKGHKEDIYFKTIGPTLGPADFP